LQGNIKEHAKVMTFLDSGAFSADTSGTPIVLANYIEYVKENEHLLDIYPVLDVLGDVKATWENQRLMEEAGLAPCPVFHADEDFSYLHRCLEYDYFCLGGLAGGVSGAVRQAFLNKCFEIICDTPDRMPKCKVHGFGLASPSLMTAYPFYSVDTSSWVAYSQYGTILIPRIDRGNIFRYDMPPVKIFVTERSPKKNEEGMHMQNLSKAERKKAEDYIHSLGFVLGSSTVFAVSADYELQDNEVFINKQKSAVERADVSGISNNNTLRYAYNLAYYNAIAESCPEWPWAWSPKIKSFF